MVINFADNLSKGRFVHVFFGPRLFVKCHEPSWIAGRVVRGEFGYQPSFGTNAIAGNLYQSKAHTYMNGRLGRELFTGRSSVQTFQMTRPTTSPADPREQVGVVITTDLDNHSNGELLRLLFTATGRAAKTGFRHDRK